MGWERRRAEGIVNGYPSTDEGGLSLAAVNRMSVGAIRGVKARKQERH